jgi:hypothetical protein
MLPWVKAEEEITAQQQARFAKYPPLPRATQQMTIHPLPIAQNTTKKRCY